MTEIYGRDLDLNLLRVFAVVAATGSVTEAAARLYLTQPAVSAALRRLRTTLGAPLFARRGRGLVLTSRGVQLRDGLVPHLQKIVEAALSPATFDPATSERTLRLGLSDTAEAWLLPALLRALEREAPGMRVVVVTVQFRTVATALAGGLDVALSVADELPTDIRRARLLTGGYTCLHDPRHSKLRPLTEKAYFAHRHVIVSYNGDLRGVVEDALGKTRDVRCSVPSFAHVGAIVEGTAMLATIPAIVAAQIVRERPRLATTRLPFAFPEGHFEMLWPAATDDDGPCRFLRERIVGIARSLGRPARVRSARAR